MAIQIANIDHVVLRVRDAPRVQEFYCEVLGCTVERVVEDFGLTQLRAGNALIDLVDVASKLGLMGGAAPGSEGHNVDHFCLRVHPFDADAILAHLARHDVEPSPIERRYGAEGFGPSIYIHDPEGNTVELKGPPEA